MKRLPLDTYDKYPKSMRDYLSQYGWHFSKKACEMACSNMWRKGPAPGTKQYIKPHPAHLTDILCAVSGFGSCFIQFTIFFTP